MRALARWSIHYSKAIVLIASALSLAGFYYSILLYQNLKPDLEEMLPLNARSVIDLTEVTQRLRSIDNLVVLVFSKNTQASKRFVNDLVKGLNQNHSPLIARVASNIKQELNYFSRHKALYMDLSDLVKIRNHIWDKIDYEKQLYDPLNLFRSTELPEPRLDIKRIENKYKAAFSTYTHFPEGYFATPDETTRAVLVYMQGKLSGVVKARALRNLIDREISDLKPMSYAPDLEIRFTGEIESIIEEHAALVGDLEVSGILVAVLVSIVILVYFRSWRATFALVLSLFMGTAFTLGFAYFAVGHLNANSAFLGSIILGNGINFGIILVARYQEERRQLCDQSSALITAMVGSSSATLTAALAAGLSYGSLLLTDFRGFNQFGLIGLVGMILCWFSSYTVLPALLVHLDNKPIMSGSPLSSHQGFFMRGVAFSVNRWPKVIVGVSLLLTGLSFYRIAEYQGTILETDLRKVRSKESWREGSAFYSHYVDKIFKRYLTPIAILAHSRADSVRIANQLRLIKSSEGDSSLIASVQTINDFIPKRQSEKIRVLRQIQSSLTPSIRRHLSGRDRRLVRELLTPQVFRKIGLENLPPLIQETFTEQDGSIGKLVLVEPPVRETPLELPELIHFVNQLRTVADSVGEGVPVAGALPISADVLISIQRDGPNAALFAFIAVILLVSVLFRRPTIIAWVIMSLILGVVWLLGAIFIFDKKINFLNFIAIPITFGIGVDYGVNVFQRIRREGVDKTVSIIKTTGGAVALCSLTTIIGYGSLLVAKNQALNSFGLLAAIGEMTCIVAALICLPAGLILAYGVETRRGPLYLKNRDDRKKKDDSKAA